jgi:acetyltransferase-like isoleucine patch superfamily enzyme
MAFAALVDMSLLSAIFMRHKLRGCVVGEGVSVSGSIWVHGGGTVRLGARVRLDASTAPIELHSGPSGEIIIGDDVYVGGGTSIEAEHSVRIGDRCRIGAFSKIIDTHYHRLEGNRHERTAAAAVVVEDDVELGPRSVLLPRAHIGCGSMLRAGTVVTRRFPPASILAGIPAAVRGRTNGETPR